MKKSFPILILLLIGIINAILPSCKKEDAVGTDKELLDLAQATAGFTWYKNANTDVYKRQSLDISSNIFLKSLYLSLIHI